MGLLRVLQTSALYKQWLLNTNFENGTNWDKGTVPCSSDRIHFLAQREVSVYVEAAHSILEMNLPLDGEFILSQEAGFMASSGDTGCGPGSTVIFRDSEDLQWFNPSMWQAATSWDDLEKGSFLFSVHDESVPCPHDDVVFHASSSFRVDTTGNKPEVPVRSLSILGYKFTSNEEFTRYLGSPSGRLQFHGDSSVYPGKPACTDASGCTCDNSANHDRICAATTCSPTDCRKPLHPVGHCCNVCGAIVLLQSTSMFNLESYRQRLQHLFLIQPPYRHVRMAISKVFQIHWLLRLLPRAAADEVQLLLLDGETGAESGMVAENLAREIVKDALLQGEHLGISSAEFKASSGNSSEVTESKMGLVASITVGILLLLSFLLLLGFLFQRGIIKVPSLPSLSSWRKANEIGELGGPLDHGFDNPMFDKPVMMPAELGLYTPDPVNFITVTSSGVHFVNPVYDDTDFNA
uniref:Protein amnionless n=1 Tax=Scleropages formosus TaxID=113540 RepID=A0A8C9RDK0_SCLFO